MPKIIFSRKGFDSKYGGVASPIFDNGSMISLPIPSSQDSLKIRDITYAYKGDSLGRIVGDLTRKKKQKITDQTHIHLDPDIRTQSRGRLKNWRPAFGQIGAAQSHLANEGVSEGDLFLFFGWFRKAEKWKANWRFIPGAPDIHVIFGWLEIGKVLSVGSNWEKVRRENPWLREHPHLSGTRSQNNTIYLASDWLSPHFSDDQRRPGGSDFSDFSENRVLTSPSAKGRSTWQLPEWFMPEKGRPALTCHSSPDRWERNGVGVTLKSVAIGQEFVLDCDFYPEAFSWVQGLFAENSAPAQKAVTSRQSISGGKSAQKRKDFASSVKSINGATTVSKSLKDSSKKQAEDVYLVMLRQPKNHKDDRDDPFWEFGSFGVTGCHDGNLLHFKNAKKLEGARLAFAQGGDQCFRLVCLTPKIRVLESKTHPGRFEALWDTKERGARPWTFKGSPLLIDNRGCSDFEWVRPFIENVTRKTFCGKFASKFKTRKTALKPSESAELIQYAEDHGRYAADFKECIPRPIVASSDINVRRGKYIEHSGENPPIPRNPVFR